MKIGYLHIGPSENGICRYGRLLADEACKRVELTVIEVSVTLTEDYKYNLELLTSASQELEAADFIHVQYSCKNNAPLWGKSWAQFYHFWFFKRKCQCPIVITLHDVCDLPPSQKISLHNYFDRYPSASAFQNHEAVEVKTKFRDSRTLTNILIVLKRAWHSYKQVRDSYTLNWLLSQVKLILVCSEEEARRLNTFVNNVTATIVPHFVEQRSLNISTIDARASLNLNASKIVTLLGFIHLRKGHRLMIEALAHLPPDVNVIFAGGTAGGGTDKFMQDLIALAKIKGVDDRLKITGYLSEEDLERYLIATDLAVCPFQFFSASGSLSTWISAARSILVYDLPQVAEYNTIEPESIKTFRPYTPDALAGAIKQLFSTSQVGYDPSVDRLRQKLSIFAIFNTHLKYYREISTKSSSASSLTR
jgi:glycosyltransferase involved in cell wall biosynthesis